MVTITLPKTNLKFTNLDFNLVCNQILNRKSIYNTLGPMWKRRKATKIIVHNMIHSGGIKKTLRKACFNFYFCCQLVNLNCYRADIYYSVRIHQMFHNMFSCNPAPTFFQRTKLNHATHHRSPRISSLYEPASLYLPPHTTPRLNKAHTQTRRQTSTAPHPLAPSPPPKRSYPQTFRRSPPSKKARTHLFPPPQPFTTTRARHRHHPLVLLQLRQKPLTSVATSPLNQRLLPQC